MNFLWSDLGMLVAAVTVTGLLAAAVLLALLDWRWRRQARRRAEVFAVRRQFEAIVAPLRREGSR